MLHAMTVAEGVLLRVFQHYTLTEYYGTLFSYWSVAVTVTVTVQMIFQECLSAYAVWGKGVCGNAVYKTQYTGISFIKGFSCKKTSILISFL